MLTYKRILLKLSGEALSGKKGYGIDEEILTRYIRQIMEIHEMGVETGIVIGGGNIFRGLSGANKGYYRINCHFYLWHWQSIFYYRYRGGVKSYPDPG